MTYREGLHEVGAGVYAYLQPAGGWGLSNAGFIHDGSDGLVVDTLITAARTDAMLRAIAGATGIEPDAVRQLVNTHGDPDHTNGNFLLRNADVIASQATVDTIPAHSSAFADAMRADDELGAYLREIFGAFVPDSQQRIANHTFTGETELHVGDRLVRLIQVGPAHTAGDVLVHLPAERIVFTGDVLFIEGTPLMWAGPVDRWIAACERIATLGADVIVPGHGPVTDVAGVLAVRDYLVWIDAQARERYEAGMSVEQAADDIDLGDYRNWIDSERIVANVQRLFDNYRGDAGRPNVLGLFAQMAHYRNRHAPSH